MRSFCGGGQWQLHLCYCDHGLTKLEKNKVWRGAGRRRAQSEGNTSIKVVSDLDHDVRRREQRVEVQIFSRAAKVILRCDMYMFASHRMQSIWRRCCKDLARVRQGAMYLIRQLIYHINIA